MLTPLPLAEVFTAAECDRITALVEDEAFADAGLVRGARDDNIRRARIHWLDESGPADWVFDRLVGTAIEANRTHFGFDLAEFAERAQVAWYAAAQDGHFDWHMDIGDGPLARKRKLTLVAQLSDEAEYEGGDLELNASGRPAAAGRKRGDAILFPSFVPHRVTPVTSGARYSLTIWIHGPDFR